MSEIRVDSVALREVAAGMEKLARRLDLGQANYLRNAIGPEVTAHKGLSDAIDDFENEWDMGRDRIMMALTSLSEFLLGVAQNYEAAEAALRGPGAVTDTP